MLYKFSLYTWWTKTFFLGWPIYPKVVFFECLIIEIEIFCRCLLFYQHTRDDISPLIEQSRGLLPSSDALFPDIFEGTHRWYVLIVELVPGIEFLWVKVGNVVETVECHKATQNKQSCVSIFGWNLVILGCTIFIEETIRRFWRCRFSALRTPSFQEILKIYFWRDHVKYFIKKIPTDCFVRCSELKSKSIHVWYIQ